MGKNPARIGVVAPSSPFEKDVADRVTALASRIFPDETPEIRFHPQCFERDHHFAGSDDARLAGFLEYTNDPDLDAIWFARGGYGSCRIADKALADIGNEARGKHFLGYSDAGMLLSGLYNAGFSVAHGPMCQDIVRDKGEEAIARALRWLVTRDPEALEPDLDPDRPNAAFNLMVLSQIIGTPLEPKLDGHVLLLEEVSEHLYAIDRSMHHVTATAMASKLAGIRLGRCSDIPENDVDFGHDPEQIARYWCERHGIPWLGHADIGHDAANRIVPFGYLTGL